MFQLPSIRKYGNLTSGVLTTPYGGKTNYEGFHPGIDIANVKGTPVNAPVSGTIIDAKGGAAPGQQGFGNTVSIRDPRGNVHQLGHLDRIGVRTGAQVSRGAPIGTMGNSGSAYSASGKGDGTHLDYRIVSAYGRYKNPLTYIKNL